MRERPGPYNQKSKTLSDDTLLGRTPREVFVVSSFHFHLIFIFIFDLQFIPAMLHFILLLYIHLSMFFILLLFFIHICLSMSSLTLPWTIAGFLHPFYSFRPPSTSQVIRDTFIFHYSVIFLLPALRP